jgi:hypothetical protein
MIVDLASFPDLGLIVKAPTGVRYTSQTAGLACEHPEVEGFFVPLQTKVGRPEVAALQGIFTGDWHALSDAKADQLDRALNRHGLSSIRVDRSMLAECKEAWVHVLISTSKSDALPLDTELDHGRKGILIWPNSD